MAGTARYSPPTIPLARAAVPIDVVRYTGYRFAQGSPPDPDKPETANDASNNPAIDPLPNIRAIKARIVQAGPGSALLRYILDDKGVLSEPDWPRRPEQVLAFDKTGPYLVRVDDRVCIFGTTSKGDRRIFFDGFVQLPTSDVDHDKQVVAFQALGTPVRCWDYPLWGAVYRSAATPATKAGDRTIDAPIRFNPDGKANATRVGEDGTTGNYDHPCFLDPAVCEDRRLGRHWTVAMAARYILARGNRHEAWVNMPRMSAVDTLLDSRTPKEGQILDPNKPDTFDAKPILLDDLDVTGIPWPDALAKVIGPHGFSFRFALDLDSAGKFPIWSMEFYRTDVAGPGELTSVSFQPFGEAFDPAKTNVESFKLTRDAVNTANEFVVECEPTRHEGSFVLAPGYTPDTADVATESAKTKFVQTDDGHLAVIDKYRLYVFDEAGDGHYDRASSAYVTGQATPLPKTLGGPKADEKAYAGRRRPILGKLISRDGIDPTGAEVDDEPDDGVELDGKKGRPLRPQLHVSTDYAGKIPGEWDGTGTWFRVGGGWRALDDRLGIFVTAPNPDAWSIGNQKVGFGVAQFSSGGSIKGITAQAKAGETRFILRVTGAIEGDDMIDAVAPRRPASPTRFTVRRYIDGRKKYYLDRVEKHSALNTVGSAIVARSDTGAAFDDAIARRAAEEMPELAGPLTLSRIINTFKVGQQIAKIRGRGISLRTNATAEGEGSRYPVVVAIEYQFDPRQSTTLQLGDGRGGVDG